MWRRVTVRAAIDQPVDRAFAYPAAGEGVT